MYSADTLGNQQPKKTILENYKKLYLHIEKAGAGSSDLFY
jgi:hypothetical protein